MQIKKQKGFTLIELMIVIVIIGILAAIAVPNFLRYREKQKLLQEQKTIVTGIGYVDALPIAQHVYTLAQLGRFRGTVIAKDVDLDDNEFWINLGFESKFVNVQVTNDAFAVLNEGMKIRDVHKLQNRGISRKEDT